MVVATTTEVGTTNLNQTTIPFPTRVLEVKHKGIKVVARAGVSAKQDPKSIHPIKTVTERLKTWEAWEAWEVWALNHPQAKLTFHQQRILSEPQQPQQLNYQV